MGWKKVITTVGGGGLGSGIGTISTGPIFAAFFGALGGPAAPITATIGYGIGCGLTGLVGAVMGKKLGDAVEDEEE